MLSGEKNLVKPKFDSLKYELYLYILKQYQKSNNYNMTSLNNIQVKLFKKLQY